MCQQVAFAQMGLLTIHKGRVEAHQEANRCPKHLKRVDEVFLRKLLD